ncbi:hypothetical protein ACFLZM_07585 [Thermodesulfobacteriota bacterium]
MLKNFLSDKRPDFALECVCAGRDKKWHYAGVFDKMEDPINSVKIIWSNYHYELQAELVVFEKAFPVNIGFVDCRKQLAQFYDMGPVLTRRLLAPFYRMALNFFLIENNGFLLHSAGVVCGDDAYIFSGPGGIGKSTIAALSNEFKVLADDFVCIRKIEDSFYAYSTPWYGGKGQEGYEIKRLFFLFRDEKTQIIDLKPAQTVNALMTNMYYNTIDEKILGKLMSVLCLFVESVPGYWLSFSLKDDLWAQIRKFEKNDENTRCCLNVS